jgi:hypothetical protein
LLGNACLGLFLGKCAYELATGQAILAPDLGQGVKLLPAAHALGALAGYWLGRATPKRLSAESFYSRGSLT